MSSDKIPYTKISLFSKLVQDYLAQNERLVPFYNRHNTIENFIPQISEKEKNKDLKELTEPSHPIELIALAYNFNNE